MIGIVVIGKNEGERLRRCFASLPPDIIPRPVYVDSGSEDDSVVLAGTMGCDVVELDPRRPFSAARARNEGFQRLLTSRPDIRHVQFIDGDSELEAEWLHKASVFLARQPEVAAVCGSLRERHPDRSVYNLLCDMEWDASAGEVRSCGGIAMYRADAFARSGGFRESLVAGEEPELCFRLRQAGWKIWRLQENMATHDANIMSFAQWWRRTARGGRAVIAGALLHGLSPERYRVRRSLRSWVWALVIPVLTLGAVSCFGARGTLLLLLYPIQVIRLVRRGSRGARENWLCAVFLVLGYFAEMSGQIQFCWQSLTAGVARLMKTR